MTDGTTVIIYLDVCVICVFVDTLFITMKGVVVFLVVCMLSLAATAPVCNGGSLTLPNPEDCSTFFTCYNELPVLTKCFPGLWFNPEIGVCDFPVNVDGSGCIPPTTTTQAVETTTQAVETTTEAVETTTEAVETTTEEQL